jgi:hypothetical protein
MREKERNRETEKQRIRETEKERNRETEKQRNRKKIWNVRFPQRRENSIFSKGEKIYSDFLNSTKSKYARTQECKLFISVLNKN